MNDAIKHQAIKKTLRRFSGLVLLTTLVACGTPHSVSLSPKVMNVTGNHVVGDFSITRVQLDINGRSSQTIKKNEGLNPRAIIKYQGSGVFQANWLLDGQVVAQVNSVLNRGSVLTLNPKAIKTPVPGRHVIRLQILQPTINFKTPELKVFVAQ